MTPSTAPSSSTSLLLDAVTTAGAGIRARAVICHHAEIAIDVDRPETLALIRGALDDRQAPAAR